MPDFPSTDDPGPNHINEYSRLRATLAAPSPWSENTTVHRYELPLVEDVLLPLPANARVLSVAPSTRGRDALDLWALVDPEAGMVPRRFHVLATGDQVSPGELGAFVGTAILPRVGEVYHVFEAAV